ncbi:NAD(P)H-binding protein [Streptomyces sp. MZ04]|uniref:SDR family oxidoreductase n=1 Tax=Streptomyces sp. MZ04 TaxID=2559236 RepID=UPI001ADF11A4|nr:NAD(P)H-binding protein [Streptomyces sp. MZ04]
MTGAFGYSGAAIARHLQDAGRRVRTVTGHPHLAPAGTEIEVRPLDFEDPARLADALQGVDTLYNTYWVRFGRGGLDHATATARSRTLFRAAADAGVRRVVHLSITHPSADSPYPYFREKARTEQALAEVGLPHSILRPAILFGGRGVLLNNIAWLLRRLPVFAIGGDGGYRIRGIHVDDLARLCIEEATRSENATLDAVGPERPTFDELVRSIADTVGSRARILHVPARAIPPLSAGLGLLLRDKLLTADEYGAMADGLADTDGPATGTTALSEWLHGNGDSLGLRYANELARHYDQ